MKHRLQKSGLWKDVLAMLKKAKQEGIQQERQRIAKLIKDLDKLMAELNRIFSMFIVTRQSILKKPLEEWNKKYDAWKKQIEGDTS